MARDTYNNTVVQRKDDGNLAALGNVQVTVISMFDNSDATIYQSRLGAAQGPTPGSGGTGSNPFTTGNSGSVEFWADPGEYQVRFHDLQNPPRFADYAVGWMSLPAGFHSIPGVVIKPDGTLPFGALDSVARRQFDPIGTVNSWWRPSAAFDAGAGVGLAPPGWEICDGRAVGQQNHDFGPIGTITLPDMRNVFELGADITKAHDIEAVGDTSADGPGIGEQVHGTNYHNLAHGHTVTSHSHGSITELSALSVITSPSGSHLHSVLGTATASASPTGVMDAGIGSAPYNYANHTHGVSAGTTTDGAHAHFVQQHNHVIPPESPPTTVGGLSAIFDIKPRYVGLLRIMKVKRS